MGTVAELGRQVLGGGYRVEVEAEGQGLAERARSRSGRAARSSEPARTGCRLLCRPRCAAGSGRGRGRRPAAGSSGFRSTEPSLEAIYTRYFQKQSGAAQGGAPCGVKVRPCTGSASSS